MAGRRRADEPRTLPGHIPLGGEGPIGRLAMIGERAMQRSGRASSAIVAAWTMRRGPMSRESGWFEPMPIA